MLTTILTIFIIYKIVKNKKERNLNEYIKAEREVELARKNFMQLSKDEREIVYNYGEAITRADLLRSKII